MKKEKTVKYYAGIDRELRNRGILAIASIIASVVVCTIATIQSYDFAKESRDVVYVIDKGSTMMAQIAEGGVQRDLEIEDHIVRFHQLFFNLAPSAESQQRHLEQALHMADRSAYNWWQDQSESGYYSRLISANISQEIMIDSVKFDMQVYPYPATVYGKVYLTRESNITAYDFASECQLTDVARSQSNPHGLMIEKFAVTRYESIGTRKRR